MPPIPDPRVTRAEAAALTPVCLLAAAVLGGWLCDVAGAPITPLSALPAAAIVCVPCCAALWRGARPDRGGLILWGAVTGLVLTLLLCWAWPSLLPLGSGPDLVHHLALIHYIETHRSLVHDPAAERWLGEMVGYTPGSHLLAVIAGQVTGAGGLRAVHALVALAVALKAGLVLVITLRAVRCGGWARIAAAATAAMFLFLPRVYTLGSFSHDSYVAQVVGETFAAAMWWALVAWDGRPSAIVMTVFALCGVATFLTWPIWTGPPLLTLAVVALSRLELPVRGRVAAVALGALPVLAVAAVYLVGRLAWAGIVKTSGAVSPPSLGGFGLPLTLLGGAGFVVAVRDRRLRATVVFLGAMGLQAAALYAVATSHGAETPYMAFKMFYLAACPLAVLAALAIARVVPILAREARVLPLSAGTFEALAMTLAALGVAVGVVRAQASAPPPRPAVTLPMQQAAQWLRAQGTIDCVDYLTNDWVSAYWLHIVELGHPRVSWRTQDITDRFDRRAVVGRWVDPRGDYRYGIVEDFDLLPRDARVGMDTLARFGPAAVVKRREASACPDLDHRDPQ